MKKSVKKDEPVGRIINIMADGHIEEDLTGHRVMCTPETEGAFRVAAQVARRMAMEKALHNSP